MLDGKLIFREVSDETWTSKMKIKKNSKLQTWYMEVFNEADDERVIQFEYRGKDEVRMRLRRYAGEVDGEEEAAEDDAELKWITAVRIKDGNRFGEWCTCFGD